MKDSELKKLLDRAYCVGSPDVKKQFIRKHNHRQLNIFKLLMIQIKYMNMQYIIPAVALVVLLLALAVKKNESLVYSVSAFLPFLAFVSLTGLGKARRHGMSELEMTTRFSERMVKSVRLLLAGFVGFVSICLSFFAIRNACDISVLTALFTSAFPYIITVTFSMAIIRRWHEKENIYGCLAVSAAVCVISLVCRGNIAISGALLNSSVFLLIFAVVIFLLFREVYLFINESEELQWSLC